VVSSASGPVITFFAPGLIFGDTEGVSSRFHVKRSRIRFRRHRGRRVPFSCFARPDSFSAVSGTSGPVFKFCVPGLIFGDAECVGSRSHILRAQTHFRRYRGRRVLFSSFALPDSFSAVPSASGLVLTFCAPDSFLAVPRASGPVFKFCTPGLVFGGAECVGSCFHVLRARTRF
jgi:hypothetical protein